jgi:hypothetical protein
MSSLNFIAFVGVKGALPPSVNAVVRTARPSAAGRRRRGDANRPPRGFTLREDRCLTRLLGADPTSSPAPDRGLAAAPIEKRPILALRPLRAAGPPFCRSTEGRRHAAGVAAGRRAVRRGKLDGRGAAVTLARIYPAGVAPARVLLGARAARSKEQSSRADDQYAGAGPHARQADPRRATPPERPRVGGEWIARRPDRR